MFIKCLDVGLLNTNCYVVACRQTKEAIVIDPGFNEDEAEKILEEIDTRSLRVKYIVNTHGHVDHISGNRALKEATSTPILIHEHDAPMLLDPRKNLSKMLGLAIVSPPAEHLLDDGHIIRAGRLELNVIHTPGHTEGSISLYSERDCVVFTGDTLFAGSIGRTDLPGSSFKDIIESLKDKLMKLPDETLVYPGHGERTTIGKERRVNPYVST